MGAMRILPIQMLVAASVLSASVFSTIASGDGMPGVTRQIGLVAPAEDSIPAPAGLKLPRNAAAAFGGFSGTPGSLAVQSVDQSQPMFYGGVREKPMGLEGAEAFRGVLYPLSKRWLSAVETSVSDESLLTPRRYSLASRLHATLGRGWDVSIGLKHSVYGMVGASGSSSDGSAAGPNGYLLAPTLYSGDASATSYQLKFNYLYSAHNRFGLSYTAGRDDYLYSPFDRSLQGAHQLMLTGQHWLAPNWALNYNVYTPESGNLRQGLRLGLRYRF